MADADWVAVIDDDEGVRYSLARYFKAQGIRAQTYASADEYVNRLFDELPACIILDVQLQMGMSSFQLLDWMDVSRKRAPIIFITGQVELQPELCAAYPELRDTLRKPFNPDDLIARVRHCLHASSREPCSVVTPV